MNPLHSIPGHAIRRDNTQDCMAHHVLEILAVTMRPGVPRRVSPTLKDQLAGSRHP